MAAPPSYASGHPERCPSGLRSAIGNRVGGVNPPRGFESHPLRSQGLLAGEDPKFFCPGDWDRGFREGEHVVFAFVFGDVKLLDRAARDRGAFDFHRAPCSFHDERLKGRFWERAQAKTSGSTRILRPHQRPVKNAERHGFREQTETGFGRPEGQLN